MRQGLLVSNTITYGDLHIVHITHLLSAVKTEGLSAANLFAFAITSADNPSIVGSASCCNRCSPLHKGAKCDSASPELSSNYNITLPFARHTLCSLALILGSLYRREQIVILLFHTLHLTLTLQKLNVSQKEHTLHQALSLFQIHRQRRSPQLFIIHHSLFIIHYIKSPPSFQTTDLAIN